MATETQATTIVRHIDDAPTVPCPCGASTRVITAADGKNYSFHVTAIRDSICHYHKNSSEVYYILEGEGQIELDGIRHDVRPGSVIHIDAGVRHRLISKHGVRTMVLAFPAFDPEDEFFD